MKVHISVNFNWQRTEVFPFVTSDMPTWTQLIVLQTQELNFKALLDTLIKIPADKKANDKAFILTGCLLDNCQSAVNTSQTQNKYNNNNY